MTELWLGRHHICAGAKHPQGAQVKNCKNRKVLKWFGENKPLQKAVKLI